MSHPAAAVIAERRLLAVIRASSAAAAVETARSALAGGVTVLEVAYTTPDAAAAIRQLAAETAVLVEPPLLGAGTVLDERQAAEAVAAGARFLVSPAVVPAVIACARRLGAAALPGADTVTEVLAALEAGADLVKLFPAEVLGLKFLKAVRTEVDHVEDAINRLAMAHPEIAFTLTDDTKPVLRLGAATTDAANKSQTS